MIDYYKIFNLTLAKKRGTITDEMVKEAYEEKKAGYIKWKEKMDMRKTDMRIISDEIPFLLQEDYLQLLDDAYFALSTENARKHYDELIERIEEHIEDARKNKKATINLEEEKNKNKITKLTNTVNTTNTTEIVKKIIQDAKRKYPIKGIDQQENGIEL